MFLAYQRASRPYKRLVFDDFTFFLFFQITILILSPPRSYRHLAGVRYVACVKMNVGDFWVFGHLGIVTF